jgi:hypothetical protein
LGTPDIEWRKYHARVAFTRTSSSDGFGLIAGVRSDHEVSAHTL